MHLRCRLHRSPLAEEWVQYRAEPITAKLAVFCTSLNVVKAVRETFSTNIYLWTRLGQTELLVRKAHEACEVTDANFAGFFDTENESDELCKQQAVSKTSVWQLVAELDR